MNPVSWSTLAVSAADGRVLAETHPDRTLPSASAAKLLVLLAAADGLESGELSADEPLDRESVASVADSGLWHRLSQRMLPLDDVARLIGACSDNLATNVLVARLGGVERITACAAARGIRDVVLHDIVRDERTPAHPPTLSSGSAAGYVDLVRRLALGDGIAPAVGARVTEWLRDGADLSMVAAAFGLDPLAHRSPDRGVALWNKTGTDTGTRVDVGLVERDGEVIAYACLARWEPSSEADPERDDVLAGMRALGDRLRAALS